MCMYMYACVFVYVGMWAFMHVDAYLNIKVSSNEQFTILTIEETFALFALICKLMSISNSRHSMGPAKRTRGRLVGSKIKAKIWSQIL